MVFFAYHCTFKSVLNTHYFALNATRNGYPFIWVWPNMGAHPQQYPPPPPHPVMISDW